MKYFEKQIDKKTNITSKFYYDVYGNVITIEKNKATNDYEDKELYVYDERNRLK